jgi:Ni,Fe-hydrogenase I small subunit
MWLSFQECTGCTESLTRCAVGSCAGSGGLPAAAPSPTGAMGIGELMAQGLVPQHPFGGSCVSNDATSLTDPPTDPA